MGQTKVCITNYELFQITSILLHSCPDLLLHLDFHGVNPTPIQTTVKNSQDIRIESVSFDQKYKDRQRLKMAFSNVGSATFSSLSITEALEVRVFVVVLQYTNIQ